MAILSALLFRKPWPAATLPRGELELVSGQFLHFPACGQTYIFGYDFFGTDFGRACRDIVNGGWVVVLFRG
jgi:hypothetical protein